MALSFTDKMCYLCDNSASVIYEVIYCKWTPWYIDLRPIYKGVVESLKQELKLDCYNICYSKSSIKQYGQYVGWI